MPRYTMSGRYGPSHAKTPWQRETVLKVTKVRQAPVRFNSGPTPRDAVMDFLRLSREFPEVWG